ncbi:hypothetical protein IG631_19850 [Alternaria alternata]|nr:hypothetical protein IG631_19850 [Alternaria alternata]
MLSLNILERLDGSSLGQLADRRKNRVGGPVGVCVLVVLSLVSCSSLLVTSGALTQCHVQGSAGHFYHPGSRSPASSRPAPRRNQCVICPPSI